MISSPVRVVSVVDGVAMVEQTGQSGCGSCQSRSVCGVSVLGKYFSNGRAPIAVSCASNVRAGDMLEMNMSETELLKAGVMAYLLPCLLAILGAGLATFFKYPDVFAALGALAGLILGLLMMRIFKWSPGIAVHSNH